MIKHVVLLKFKPGVTEEDVESLEKGLDALPGAIPEILSYDFGRDIVRSERSFDFGLVSSFKDLESLKRYQVHPEHVKVLEIVKRICDQIVAVDFTF
ncbi:Stress responsive A/B Barrel Domain [Desulfacinum hydrothermale DSM 13146]|uniref:Stress responsive A/B Barrel Domain n=1 Tax=Desulfacinum hydrothermale DSM 13146 TaxID=1121390 RepID=A0A1W1X552_9BACT|nr:Dabb family protein [Desulfacinum hydrothermale]SMC19079.1 Stress responsive A/B Barrel Domain [Desulfacinum hydrothermale DSM 13146]